MKSPVSTATQTILLAVTGMSPAVLTETVWALAHPADKTVERIIPDRVIVLTTTKGAREIKDQLFGTDHVWESLRNHILGPSARKDNRLHFGVTPDCLKVFTRKAGGKSLPLDDISSEVENAAVADCITDELWGHVAKPDTRIIASISGGFKTMSALLFSSMTLLGRSCDLITHVLVNAPFDDPRLTPRFYFPKQPQQELKDRDGKVWRACDAQLRLGFVPFVPLNDLLEKYKKPRSYSDLVAQCRGNLDRRLYQPVTKLRLRISTRQVWINDHVEFKLGAQPFLFLLFLAERARNGDQSLGKYMEAMKPFAEFVGELQHRWKDKPTAWMVQKGNALPKGFIECADKNDEGPIRTKLRDRLCLRIRSTPGAGVLEPYLPEARRCTLDLPPDTIEILD
jgi:CRISPR-associated protein (TIGR02584 family)